MDRYEEEMKEELDGVKKENIQQMREAQRQKLIESLVKRLLDKKAELDDKMFHIVLALVITKYLGHRRMEVDKPVIGSENLGTFFASVLVTIRNFARTKEEEDVLVAQFLEKVLAGGLSPFYNALNKQDLGINMI